MPEPEPGWPRHNYKHEPNLAPTETDPSAKTWLASLQGNALPAQPAAGALARAFPVLVPKPLDAGAAVPGLTREETARIEAAYARIRHRHRMLVRASLIFWFTAALAALGVGWFLLGR